MTTDSTVASGGREWLVVAVTFIVASSIVVAGIGPLTASAVATTDPATEAREVGGPAASPTEPGVLSGDVNLSDANTTFRGAAENDSLGAAVTDVGDLDGDGVDDVVVGAPRNDTAGPNAGAVYVFYGPVEPGEMNASTADVTLNGAAANSRAGAALDAADLDGDNVSELLVGVPGDDTAGENAGAVYVVRDVPSLPANASLAAASSVLYGTGAGDRAGTSVAGVGNLTDGTPDSVLVGAPGNDSVGEDAGAVALFDDVPVGNASLAEADATFVGEASGDRAGASVDTAGDFDGDGDHDLLVGAPRNDSTAVDAGAAYVLTAETFDATQSLADAQVKYVGATGRDLAGFAVSYAGDVNNDSFDDIVVGAPFNDSNGDQAGAAYVVPGTPEAAGTANLSAFGLDLYGESAGDRAGWSVSSAGSGDVTCDPYADVLVGAPGNNSTAPNAGAAYLVEGSETLADARNLSTALAKLAGVGEDDMAGRAVSDVGDVTGDGANDVVVGAPFNDSATANDTGAAYLVNGACVERTPEPEPEPSGDVVDVSCDAVTVDVENVSEGRVTVKVFFEDGTSTTATEDIGSDGEFDGRVAFDNPEDRNVSRVKLFAGGDTSGERLDDTGPIDVTCREPEPEPEPAGSIRDVTCEDVSVLVSNADSEKITVEVEFEDGTSTTATEDIGSDGEFDGRVAYSNPDDKNVSRVVLYDGDSTSASVLTETGPIDVTCNVPEPDPIPAGSIREVTCEDVSVLVSNADSENVTIEVEFEDGTNTTATAATTDGEFDGRIPFANPDDKNVTNVVLYDGDDTSAPLLTESGPVDVTCSEPEPAPFPAGTIEEVTCENVSVVASNVQAENVTVLVTFADGTNTTATAAAPGGEFDGEIPYSNPDDKNVTRVQLFEGTDTAGEQLTETGPIDVTCNVPEPDPIPAGSILDVTCENVSVLVSNADSENVTIKVEFEDGTNTTATAATTDGEFDGEIPYSNPDDKNVTNVVLYDGDDTDAPLLTESGPVDVTCNVPEPDPMPAGSIRDVTCENVSVLVSNADSENVTIKVEFEDGTNTTATAATTDGEFDGRIPFENPDDKNVTNVVLYDGDDTDAPLLTESGPVDVTCNEPVQEPPVDPEDVTLTAICVDAEDDLALYRVTNDNDVPVTVQYDVYGTDEDGELTVDANDRETFVVNTSDDGSATVRLFYDGDQIDVKASNTEQACDLGEPNDEKTTTEPTTTEPTTTEPTTTEPTTTEPTTTEPTTTEPTTTEPTTTEPTTTEPTTTEPTTTEPTTTEPTTTTTTEPTTTTTTTTTTTESGDAAISFVAFCVEGGTQEGNDPCPSGQSLLVKFEEAGGDFAPEGGDSMGVTVTVSETKEGGEPIAVEWESEEEIASVIVKAGTPECEFPGGNSGTAESCGPPPMISNVDAGFGSDTSASGLALAVVAGLSAFGVVARRRER